MANNSYFAMRIIPALESIIYAAFTGHIKQQLWPQTRTACCCLLLRKNELKAERANKRTLAGAPVGLCSWLIGWCHKTLLLSNQFRSQRSLKMSAKRTNKKCDAQMDPKLEIYLPAGERKRNEKPR